MINLYSCENNHNSTSKSDSYKSNKNNKNLSSKKMKVETEAYLQRNEKIVSSIQKMDGKDLKEQRTIITKAKSRLKDNNDNYSKLINDHNIPESYYKTKDILKYFKDVYGLLDDLDRTLKDIEQNKDYSKIKDLSKIQDKYYKQFNGKKEAEINEFLEKHDIKTELFKQDEF
ncbi:NDxxF motif lipoprotein [Staphylococcus sp. SQ8-PEA]|uniref:NDxxF motif lipoprotein n=2 Tax=Staphylococcus marylandisciuri TaxID=2981529 RepID=A0ABT2QR63_9STAP|nr:NDxxF motif lipoprotein [Staphylococcus marylandisciuri]